MKKDSYNLEILKKWISKKGYTVNESASLSDEIDFFAKEITINKNQTSKNKLYSLLHEAGHLMISNNINSFLNFVPLYPNHLYDGRTMRSRKYKVSVLCEEIEAWKKGMRIAKRLNIELDKDDYLDYMSKNVWTYIKYH